VKVVTKHIRGFLTTVHAKCREVLSLAESLRAVLPRSRPERFHEFGEGLGEEGGAWKIELFQFCGYLVKYLSRVVTVLWVFGEVFE
jgi:hypothetical protein